VDKIQGPIRISVPAAVAYDLAAFQKSIANLVERIGCRTCFSGADCTFLHERDFVINEKLEIQPSAGGSVQLLENPIPSPWRSARATLSGKAAYNLKQIQEVVANIAGRLGHPMCCSGFDIFFRQELDFMVNEAGQIRG
jgi:hypothetical protein